MNFLEKIGGTIDGLENSKTPFIYFILTFLFATTLRNFLETFSTGATVSFPLFSHFYVSYIFLSLVLIILFHLCTGEKVEKVSRIVLPCFLILIIVPLVDLMVTGGRGFEITYLFPGEHNFINRFFSFFGSFPEGRGVSPGIKLEVALVLIGSFIYFYIKKRSFFKGLLFIFLVYAVLFSYLSTPFFLEKFVNFLGEEFSHLLFSSIGTDFFLLLISFLLFWLFFLYKRKYFTEILKDIRPFRLLHFELMFFLGMVIGTLVGKEVRDPGSLEIFFDRFFVVISILFAWLFSVITNNLADQEIDKISNKDRPLPSNSLKEQNCQWLAWLSFALATIYSLAVGFKVFFMILLFIGNYFLYSMPPLRLKRIPFFSKLIISFNSLILLMVGFFFKTGEVKVISEIFFFFLVFLTASFNFIDIKDFKGDKKAGIKTLPVLFGLKKSKLLIGSFLWVSYVGAYFVLKDLLMLSNFMLVVLFFLGGAQFYIVNRKDFKEKRVFLIYLSTLMGLLIHLTQFLEINFIGR